MLGGYAPSIEAALLATPLPATAASAAVEYLAVSVTATPTVTLFDGSVADANVPVDVSTSAYDPLSDIGVKLL